MGVMIRQCAWCKPIPGNVPELSGTITHTICGDCERRLLSAATSKPPARSSSDVEAKVQG